MEGDTYDVMQNRECIVFERTRDACESRQVHPAYLHLQNMRMAAHFPAGIFFRRAAQAKPTARNSELLQ